MADASRLTPVRRRVLTLIKRHGPVTASEMAEHLDQTDVAARQHLAALEKQGYVRSEQGEAVGRGRPPVRWSLTEDAASVFPDSHAELTVGLIGAIREAVGEDGLLRIVEVRARDQANLYRTLLPAGTSLRKRVHALAAQRTAEGYMAEVVEERPGTYLLVEHHCPICEAARSCTGLCTAELNVFRQVLGDDVDIERIAHLLSEGDRCVYRIQVRRST